MSPEAALERARRHCFSAGAGDSGEALCLANMSFGLAKIHDVQRQLGLPPDATFVGAPDATVTRNGPRWRQGFGYGGRIQWTGDLAVLDEKPNACGMLVGALPELVPEAEAREAARRVAREGLVLDGTPLDYDLHESNHFVDVLTVRESVRGTLPSSTLFVMHSSGHEHRGPGPRGPGLYYDESDELRRAARVPQTPWGTLTVLEGDAAWRWFEFVERVQAFNLARREAFARAIFGPFTVIANATHQGLLAPNDANIGCYVFEEDETDGTALYPLTLSPTLPAYLVKPRPNLSESVVESLGWAERARSLGVLHRVTGANLLPHGGGYTYPQFRGVGRVVQIGPDRRAFELEPTSGGEPILVEDVRALPFGYRGLELVDRTVALGLAEPVHTLDVRYVLSL
ncbi:MAG: hypothetical protein HYY06_20600 [Deltaproteobacteria bacterium]|nr:hypothetical protein [Deltaproteobacteria bacterium]